MASRLLVASGLSREILTLAQYARLRLKRLELARARRFRELEALDRRLRYGFWTDPLRLPPLLMEPWAFEESLRAQEEKGRALPLFLNAFHLGPGGREGPWRGR